MQNTAGDVAWAADNATLFYVTKDAVLRPDKVHRCCPYSIKGLHSDLLPSFEPMEKHVLARLQDATPMSACLACSEGLVVQLGTKRLAFESAVVCRQQGGLGLLDVLWFSKFLPCKTFRKVGGVCCRYGATKLELTHQKTN